MTIEGLQSVVSESGKRACEIGEGKFDATVKYEQVAMAQWMQVKMLAEIALQLRVLNDGNGARQPGE